MCARGPLLLLSSAVACMLFAPVSFLLHWRACFAHLGRLWISNLECKRTASQAFPLALCTLLLASRLLGCACSLYCLCWAKRGETSPAGVLAVPWGPMAAHQRQGKMWAPRLASRLAGLRGRCYLRMPNSAPEGPCVPWPSPAGWAWRTAHRASTSGRARCCRSARCARCAC